jgi:hypothetical protein
VCKGSTWLDTATEIAIEELFDVPPLGIEAITQRQPQPNRPEPGNMAEDLVVRCKAFQVRKSSLLTELLLQELGMEGFDRVVDKYYDTVYDITGKGYEQATKHLPRRGRRQQGTAQNVPPKSFQKGTQMGPQHQRAFSEPRDDRYRRRDQRAQDLTDDDDQGYISDRPRRSVRNDSTASRENEPTNAATSNRQVRSPAKEVRFTTVKPELLHSLVV